MAGAFLQNDKGHQVWLSNANKVTTSSGGTAYVNPNWSSSAGSFVNPVVTSVSQNGTVNTAKGDSAYALGASPVGSPVGIGSSAQSVDIGALVGSAMQPISDLVSSLGAGLQGIGSSAGTSMDKLISELRSIQASNNAWSAEQAQKQMDFQDASAKKAMQFNHDEAELSRKWQEYMSDTAHQREIKDLQAAGLNPVLSAMGGSGAPVTSGATASGYTSQGAKGDTDTSLGPSLVSLLGSMLTAQTNLLGQAMSAQSNLAVADKYTSMQELIANIQRQTSLDVVAAQTGAQLSVANINSLAQQAAAKIHAGATVSSAQISADASKISASIAASAAKYGYDLQSMTSKQLAQFNANLQKELAEKGFNYQLELQNNNATNEIEIRTVAPTSIGGLVNSGLTSIWNLLDDSLFNLTHFGETFTSAKRPR